MKEIKRRDFLKTVAIGGAILSLGNAVFGRPLEALAGGKFDIGQCKSLRVKCVSELGWYDDQKIVKDMKDAGGFDTNQWIIPWDTSNAAGSCTLIDVETLEGRHHKFLLDCGWEKKYMDDCFKREGVDKMLKSGEIEFLIISHEHLDHYWGLETVLKYNPKITIYIPSTFYPEGLHFLMGATFVRPHAENRIPHEGKLIKLKPGEINKLYEGCAASAFDCPTLVRVQGEESLYFNVKGKGIVCVTGCCHQSILTFADFGQNKILGGEKMYGLYGGLHIAALGPMDPKREHIVADMAKYHFEKIACNHCTGLVAVKRMIELGYPIVRGTARNGSKSDLYVGNGDEVFFG
jgi:7,8-dihydropterin-6-yl-methyl-4-(beta-D-ribofuranosyl)aminobenzene 5'-phosphate synthase